MSFSLFSNQFQDRFVMERPDGAVIDRIVTDADRSDATFTWTGGSLSVGTTGQLHRGVFQTGIVLHIATFDSNRILGKQFDTIIDPNVKEQVRQESTFRIEEGLIDPNQITFRSVKFPELVIRHRNFQLFAERDVTPQDFQDATFRRAPPQSV